MGVYVYTMRSQVIETGGERIGVYKFAYKPLRSWDEPPAYARMVGQLHAAASKAREKNKDITLFVAGDLADDRVAEGLPVYELPNADAAVYDDVAFDRRPVGTLVKEGRRWTYRPTALA